MRVAYLGPAGTHSEEALRASAPPGSEEVPYPTIYDAVMAVQDGTVDTAVVPIENALEGSVAVTLDTLVLDAEDVRIAAEVVQPIHHCAIAASRAVAVGRGARRPHPQATAQCARFLREHLPQAEHVSAPSTADAVQSVCEWADGVTVALGSRLAAELYNCQIVAEDIEDHPDNVTRFVWLKRANEVDEPGGDPRPRWSSGEAATSRPGWLVDLLWSCPAAASTSPASSRAPAERALATTCSSRISREPPVPHPSARPSRRSPDTSMSCEYSALTGGPSG